MKLQDIEYQKPVQSLGRHDIHAPMREAEAESRAIMAQGEVVKALADTAAVFEQEHTKGQVLQAQFDFDFDRKENIERYSGRDMFSKGELLNLGIEIGDEDTRPHIPAYEVMPEIMRIENRKALERRANSISNSRARAQFHASSSAALDDDHLKLQLDSRAKMMEYTKKKAQIRVDEAQDRGQFGPAKEAILTGPFSELEKREKLYKNSLIQESAMYNTSIARFDQPGEVKKLEKYLAHLIQEPEDYRGYLNSSQRKAYAQEIRTALSKAGSLAAADRKMAHEVLKTEIGNIEKLSADNKPATAEQRTSAMERATASGDTLLMEKLRRVEVLEHNVGTFRNENFNNRALWIEAYSSQQDDLPLAEKVKLLQRQKVHKDMTDAFEKDPFSAWAGLGNEMPIPVGTKGKDGKELPMGDLLRSWSELGSRIHAAQGIPGSDVQIIPKKYEQALVGKFKTGGFEGRKRLIKEMATAYGGSGETHRRLFKQLGLVENGAVYGMAGEVYSRGDELMGDQMLQGLQAIEDKAVDMTKVKSIEFLVDSKIGKMYWHDPATMKRMRKSALALAVGRAAGDGNFDELDDYVDKAAEAMATPVKYNGNYLPAPYGVSPRDVRKWFDDITIDEISAHGGVGGADPERFIKGLHNGDLIPKVIDDGKYVFLTAIGTPVPNASGGPLILEYSKRPVSYGSPTTMHNFGGGL